MDVVMSMNAVFSCFDALMDRYNVYKVRKLFDMPTASQMWLHPQTSNGTGIPSQPRRGTPNPHNTHQETETTLDIRWDKMRWGHWTDIWINDTTNTTLAYRELVRCFLIANKVLIKKMWTGIVVLRIHPGWGKINKTVSTYFGASQIKVAKMFLLFLLTPWYLCARNKPEHNRAASGNQNTSYTHGGELWTHKHSSHLWLHFIHFVKWTNKYSGTRIPDSHFHFPIISLTILPWCNPNLSTRSPSRLANCLPPRSWGLDKDLKPAESQAS